MILWSALVAAEVAALLLAVRARKTSGFRASLAGAKTEDFLPVLFAFALVDELAVEAIHRALVGAPRPFAGTARVLYHLETALVLGWPCLLAVTAWRVFGPVAGRSRVLVVDTLASAYLGAVAALAALHPLSRSRTAAALHAAELVAVVASVAAIALAWRRPWGRPAVLVGVLVAVEACVALLGPWAHDVFADWSRLALVPYALGFGTVAGIQLSWIVRPTLRR